jgi:Protein of unknown function (DUF1822)
MNATDTSLISVPLGHTAHEIAKQRALQSGPLARKRVYLSALAMVATQQYLKYLQIRAEIIQLPQNTLFDFATLALPSQGLIECRPVLPGETVLSIPHESTENRLGGVAVYLNQNLSEGQILGFVESRLFAVEEISLTLLRPIEILLEKIGQSQPKPTIILSNWLEDQFDHGWELLDNLLSGLRQPILSYRNPGSSDSVSGGRLIDLGVQLKDISVALLINLSPIAQGSVGIQAQLCAIGDGYLPPNLKLMIMDDCDQLMREVVSRSMDNLIQLAFDGEVGEKFQVKVSLGEFHMTEIFTI